MAATTQFCVCLSNKLGALSKLCDALKRAKVNIEAISVADNADCCCVRLIAKPAAGAKAALTKAKYSFCTQQVLTVGATNKPGELARISGRLARARVNINYVYGTTGGGESAMLVFSVSDVKKAQKAVGD